MTLAASIEGALRTRGGEDTVTLTIGPIEDDGSVTLELKVGPERYLFAADTCTDEDLIPSIEVITRVVDPVITEKE